MAKIKALKKIAALVTAIALVVCFAVSASAINVVTKTTYTPGSNDELVDVKVTVTGLDPADTYVTYYATDASSNPVHIDQVAAEEGNKATFNFRTEATKLESSVVIGRTSADAAHTGETIDGLAITWKIDGGTESEPDVIATEAESYTITSYVATSGKVFSHARLNGEEVEAREEAGNITVPLASLGDEDETATIVIYEKDAPVGTPTVAASIITAGAVVVEDGNYKIYNDKKEEIAPEAGDEDILASETDNRKLTVIGNSGGATEFGIIISDEEITVDKLSATQFAKYDSYEALGASKSGTFAIQLIDSETADHAVIPDAGVYVAVYAFDGSIYSVAALADVVKAVTVEQ